VAGTESTDNYTFFYGNGNTYHYLGTGISVHKGTISVAEFVSDRMSYLIIRGRWCDMSTIVLNVLF
jgi:hypothetical protein